jgi:hypothetical protein
MLLTFPVLSTSREKSGVAGFCSVRFEMIAPLGLALQAELGQGRRILRLLPRTPLEDLALSVIIY